MTEYKIGDEVEVGGIVFTKIGDLPFGPTQHNREETQVSNGWDDEPQSSGGFNWDDEDVQPTAGEFLKFPNVGDRVIGTITAIRKQRFEDSDGVQYAPQLDLTLDDGSEATLTAGQTHLKRLLIEKRPEVGDMIRVIHTGKQGRMKIFSLDVRRGAGAAPAKPAKAARPPAKRVASAPPVDDWSNGAAADDGIPF
jgi:hypothetical protein